MRKKSFIGVLPILFALPLFAQRGASSPADSAWLHNIPASKRNPAEVHRLIDLSNQYINKEGENITDLDMAWQLAAKAGKLSQHLQYDAGYQQSLQALCLTQIERGDSRSAWKLIEQAQDSTKAEMLYALQRYYFYGGQISQSLDSSILCLEKAATIAKSHGFVALEFHVRSDLATRYIDARKNASFTEQQARVVQLQKSVSSRALLGHYENVALYLFNNGVYRQSLDMALTGLRLSEDNKALKTDLSTAALYNLLGVIHFTEKQYQKSIDALTRAWEIYKAAGETNRIWNVCESMVYDYIYLKEPEKALEIIERTLHEVGYTNTNEEIAYLRILSYFQQKTGQAVLTEQTINRLVTLVEETGIIDAQLYNRIANFYLERKAFSKARYYLEKAVVQPGTPPHFQASVNRSLFFLDSATGNYLSAIQYLRRSQQLDDSMNNLDKEKQIRGLLVQYETEKKDRDLRLKEQSITLLSRQSELRQKDLERARLELDYETRDKQQQLQMAGMEARAKDKNIQLQKKNIELLEKDGQLQRNNLQQANITRNRSVAGAVLLLIILLLVYNSYRLKKAASVELDKKNGKLERLINEKELLLREVHHRVKNNLQTVVSLLELQADSLSSDALAAIQASQNRIYATSLLHQKLYQDDTISSVNMRSYLPELVCHLKQAFHVRNEIEFTVNIDSIDLDVSQAVPVGLIVNEAITNSIKYAFPDGHPQARISVSLATHANGTALLDIADNGIGLPAGVENGTTGLGLTLVKGLAEDIDGEPHIASVNGTKVSVRFKTMAPLATINNPLNPSNLQA
ncbi:histidine kinase dimerization/phosphoacceptor domain -containing protein [Flavihumibacter petaseus]|uniref:histidine kinase n=1 Tax=Flavihumibacter petaseus NBRC 106054 TaxID=1220578 RepID=A0A0E9N230_9BACT|nr:histidine kinase dimerization/phosphoacceptor domain -containing protein [Flavihumibacter petaseus]GAO44082.1 putative two-component histidine kinase [Flavihumibacter petaseus NBRC 106054]